MDNRTELFEATLECSPYGIALLGMDGLVVFWNSTAEAITGYKSLELVGRPAPNELDSLLHCAILEENQSEDNESGQNRERRTQTHHHLGHEVPVVVRNQTLRDGLGKKIGTAVIFNPADSLDALPHGQYEEGGDIAASLAEFQDQLSVEFDNFMRGGLPFGVLWINVDQAHLLRGTHGANACESMIVKMQHSLAQGLRPAEKMGRWGDDEFLVISHERTPEMLAAHAQAMAGHARITDFRWWGDKVSLTVSIGAAQADQNMSLVDLLGQAKAAMLSSFHAGGNQITNASGGHTCLPSSES
jgi:PAS domain S-box-containing protein/diguanylate cyclase (GGDEF)-like protein